MTVRSKMWISFAGIFVLAFAAVFVVYPKSPPIKIGKFTRDLNLRLGLDLKGGTILVYDAKTDAIPSADQKAAVDSAKDVIERRVNAFGVSEPIILTSHVGSKWRVSVELAGIKDINEAIRLIGETPILEFKEEAKPIPLTDEQKKDAEKYNAEQKNKASDVLSKAKAGEDFAALANQFSEDTGNTDSSTNLKLGGDLGLMSKGNFVPEFDDVLFTKAKDGVVYPDLVSTQFGFHIIKRIASETVDENGEKIEKVRGSHILFRIKPTDAQVTEQFASTGLTGKNLKRASVQFSPTTNEPEVLLQFDGDGQKLFGEITKRNVGKTVAIYLDGAPISIPKVNQEIASGEAVITGTFTLDESKQLARRLNAGALPVPITLVNQQTVDATLGEQSIYRSLFAGIAGFLCVAFFMVVFYRLPGVLAVIALMLYSLIVLSIFKIWPVTLTLSGIAGYILSIGIAVDANILIFERTKEELRLGAPLSRAIENGFERAWLSIRDSNISSIITSLILIWFGTSFIKGFAITLIIGILISMFSAITVTRNFMRLTLSSFMQNHLWLFGISKKDLPNQE